MFQGLKRKITKELRICQQENASPLIDAFEKSDLVICKGTGNFEGLEGATLGKETIFMLKLKCKVIAEKIGLDVGEFVVKLAK